MKIWITRHGQTNLNQAHLMQGLTDEPLNETGIAQAREARKQIGDIRFDAVYTSPLDRAIVTGTIIGNVPREEIITDLSNYADTIHYKPEYNAWMVRCFNSGEEEIFKDDIESLIGD